VTPALRAAVAAALVLALPQGARAECRLALLLALDVSSSVDATEDALQRRGLAAALRSPEVRNAALSMPGEWVALAAFEWSGRYQQAQILGWTELRSAQSLEVAAARIASSQRRFSRFPTALGYAVGHAATVFASAPDCRRRILDVSGDGVNNDGFPPRLAYNNFPLDDVTVNGLPIGGHDPLVTSYYENQLIRGPDAFIEPADDFEDFERAMRRKLEREMRALILGAAPAGAGE